MVLLNGGSGHAPIDWWRYSVHLLGSYGSSVFWGLTPLQNKRNSTLRRGRGRGFTLTAAWYRTIRLSLWFVALIIALFPAILEGIHATVFDNTLLRDVLFIVIPTSALGLSTVLDYLCMNFRVISGTSLALSILAIIFNMLGLTSGLVGFLVVPKDDVAATNAELWTFSILIFLALLMSFVTETLVSTDNHRCHALRREPPLEPVSQTPRISEE